MKRISTIITIAFGLGLMAGCGQDNAGETRDAENVPDYEAEARESISEENMDAMLDQLADEISADEAADEAGD